MNHKILHLLQFASNCRGFDSLNKLLCFVLFAKCMNKVGRKNIWLISVSLASGMQSTYSKYIYLKDYHNNKNQTTSPVIIVSSSALFIRSIAFSLVGAHTISCKMFAKSRHEEEFSWKKCIPQVVDLLHPNLSHNIISWDTVSSIH